MQSSIQISYFGNEDLLQCRRKWTFLCSHTVPDEAFGRISDWVNSLDPEQDCVICGCLSGIEKFTLRRLITREIPIILTFAEKLPENIEDVARKLIDVDLVEMMGSGKLLIASFAKEEDGIEPSGRNAELRNRWMMNIADVLVAAYIIPTGRLSVQLCGRTDVKYLIPPQQVAYSAEECADRCRRLYYYLKFNLLNMSAVEAKRMLLHYLQIQGERPSGLHSALLLLVTKNSRYLGNDFNFSAFMRLWGVENIREEDWQRRKGRDGKYYLSVAEDALVLLSKMKAEFYDGELVRKLAEEAVKHYPKNSTYRSLL